MFEVHQVRALLTLVFRAVAEGRGIHSGKEQPAPRPPLNLSEAQHRATQFLSGFKRSGRIPAQVEFVAAGSRFKYVYRCL